MSRFKFSKLKRILKKIYRWVFPPNELPVLHHIYDARELFFQENDATGFNRYDMIVRLLAIENSNGKNDFGWELYRKQQNARRAGDWQNAEKRFRTLIDSYNQNGYDISSEVEIGYDLRLWDGSHRMALAMYHKQYQIACQVVPKCRNVYYGVKWYIENGFSLKEITQIYERYTQLKEEIRVSFVCTLWAPIAPFYDEIIEQLKLICDVESYTDYSFDAYNYAQMARKIYAVDDIEKWKIEKKIEYMRQNVSDNKWRIRVVKLRLDYPRFRRKDSTQNTLSQECEDIKRIIRNCYKDKLPNYFHDIICHIGDNFYQNEFIDKLFDYQKLNVDAVIETIRSYDYVLTKMDVPYMPKDFPQSYPIGKDIDIVCSTNDFQKICDAISEALHAMQLHYEIRLIEESDTHKQIRVENCGELIFLFDVFSKLENIDENFTKEMLRNRTKQRNYYIPTISYELIIRLFEFFTHGEKKHHLEFIQNYSRLLDKKLVDKYLTEEVKIMLDQIISSNVSCKQ